MQPQADEMKMLAGRAFRLVDQATVALHNAAAGRSLPENKSPFAALRSLFAESGVGAISRDALHPKQFTYSVESKAGPSLTRNGGRLFLVFACDETTGTPQVSSLTVRVTDLEGESRDFKLFAANRERGSIQFDADATSALIGALRSFDADLGHLQFGGHYELLIAGGKVTLIGESGKIQGDTYTFGFSRLLIIDAVGGRKLERVELRATIEVQTASGRVTGTIDVDTDAANQDDLSVKLKAALKTTEVSP